MRCIKISLFAIFLIGIVLLPLASAESFKVDNILLKTAIKSNGSVASKISITNTLDEKQHFEINILGLDGLVSISENSFDLEKREIRDINLVFSNLKGEEEGVYVSQIEIRGKEIKTIPVILEIESRDVLFDSNSAIFPSTKIHPGDKASLEIKIFDLYKTGASNVELTYFIKNFDDEIIIFENENLAVKDQALITRTIILPKDIEKRDYVLGVILKYKDSVGTSSAFFRVESNLSALFYYIAASIVVAFLILLWILWAQERKNLKNILKVQEKEIKEIRAKTGKRKIEPQEARVINNKFEQQLDVLERAKAGGYISRASYLKGKSRVEVARKNIRGNIYK